MESSLEIGFLRVTEKAAIAAARTMGYGKRKYSDQVAVESMREELNRLKMRGTVVIGEGERDKAPMLYVGEPLGRGWTEGEIYPEIDIAVDPLEGTNLCATGSAGAIAVLAASEKGGLLNAPDVYMDKIVVGPTAAEAVSLIASVHENLNQIAEAFQRDVNELTIVVLDRERHHDLIAQIREAGARININFSAASVTDGDLLRVVRFFGSGIRVSSLLMSLKSNQIRFVDTIYREEGSKLAVSFV